VLGIALFNGEMIICELRVCKTPWSLLLVAAWMCCVETQVASRSRMVSVTCRTQRRTWRLAYNVLRDAYLFACILRNC